MKPLWVNFWLKALAPWFAVLGLWVWGGQGAWVTLLAYHAQIVIWWLLDGRPRESMAAVRGNWRWWSLAGLGAGPLAWIMLPSMVQRPLEGWLEEIGLSGWALWLFVPYFGLVHPLLEQGHWASLGRRHAGAAAMMFGGYHALVLAPLLGWPLGLALALGLVGVMMFWIWMNRASGSLRTATTMHQMADFGVMVAVVLLVNAN